MLENIKRGSEKPLIKGIQFQMKRGSRKLENLWINIFANVDAIISLASMNDKLQRPLISIIYDYTKAGLYHPKRNCSFCQSRMVMVLDQHNETYYVWKCTLCFQIMPYSFNSIIGGIDPRLADNCIQMWAD